MLYAVSFLFSFLGGLSSVGTAGTMILSFFSLGLVLLKTVGSGVAIFSNQFYPLLLDEVSFYLIVLSFLITYLSVFSGMYHVKEGEFSKYVFFMMFILVMLTILFSIGGYLGFFVIFEFVMMPMVFIIGIWGSQKERLTANYYFFFYTLLGGVPLMLCVLNGVKEGNSFFLLTKLTGSCSVVSFATVLVVILAFLCKLPFYGVHIWLPKAHVEAPVGGSMVLAGLLLKMGGYGMLRVFMVLFAPFALGKYVFLCILGVGVIYPMFICFRQVDLKSFIAYSSVSHMAIALGGLLMYNIYGVFGGFIVFLGHGVISPLMFYSVNLIYERVSTRIVVGLGGFDLNMKFFFYYFLLVFISNMGYPPFVSFFGEVSLYFSLLSFSFYIVFFLFIFIFFSGVVMIYFLVKVFKGKEVGMKVVYLGCRELMVYWMGIYSLCLMTFMVPIL
uniref:NADH-ubiquinone oxidoreductase chain 4 n=1 Tax=Botrylloides leachii TaxID=62808 RepID=A0A024HW09_BOTLH|nr:NADH dehydrogenase subunit 4 [Botrylloides leachii]CCO25717.1 NADH dehydrogenase subunit 4 [Botrylloides leachii]CDM98945.1 NADH dehydrogenase subunit 4 [Botrylloides leachii]